MSSRWKERKAKTKIDKRCVGANLCQIKEGNLALGKLLCLGQWQWTRRDLWQPQEI